MHNVKIVMTPQIVENTNYFNPKDWLYKQLIKQENIDTDYYNVDILSIGIKESMSTSNKIIYATYQLLRTNLADDIDEINERLNGSL